MSALTLDDEAFARALGAPVASLPASVRGRIAAGGFRYERLSSEERGKVAADISQRIESGALSPVGPHRYDVWEKGWEENLEAFAGNGYELESLVPRFIRTGPIVRLNQEFVRRDNPAFELLFHDVVRRWLFLTYMNGVGTVYEFGCGSAYNLVAISELSPDVDLVGLDWAESAVSLANMIGRERGIRLRGRQFDLFQPDARLDLGSSSAVLTISALEQTGPRYEPFLQYLLDKRPGICVHMEPMVELYEPGHAVDDLAIRYHSARGYLCGFLPRLRQLADEGRIELLKVKRLMFGSLYHEAYSVVVWRPA